LIIRRQLDLFRLGRLVGPPLALLLAYDVLITVFYVGFGWRWISIDDLPLPLLGSAIALVVTLRNNASYDRWWEARSLWGSVVNNSRSFARGLITMTDDPALQASLIRHQIAYALALRCHLLRLAPWDALASYLPADTLSGLRAAANVPAAIHVAMARQLAAARIRKCIDSVSATALDLTLSALANAQGGLERIKNTPLPRQYNQFPQVFTRVYCLLLPLGLVHDLTYLTPVGSTVIGFMFLALDRIGRDLEDPFENTLHDIPMQAITRTIEADLLHAIGSESVPAPVGVRDGVLW
jgi:putative membrane protein